MLKTFSTLISILLSLSIWGQTAIDDLVSIDFPGEVTVSDTIVGNYRMLEFSSVIGEELYILRRVTDQSGAVSKSSGPSDLKSLRYANLSFIKGLAIQFKQFGINAEPSKEIMIDTYYAYNTRYVDNISGNQVAESNLILLDGNFYAVIYFNRSDFDSTLKDQFFNSLKINSSKHPTQISSSVDALMVGELIGQLLVVGLVIVGLVFLFKRIDKMRNVNK